MTTDVNGPLRLVVVALLFFTVVLPAALALAELVAAVLLVGALVLTAALVAVGCFVSFWLLARKGIVA